MRKLKTLCTLCEKNTILVKIMFMICISEAKELKLVNNITITALDPHINSL